MDKKTFLLQVAKIQDMLDELKKSIELTSTSRARTGTTGESMATARRSTGTAHDIEELIDDGFFDQPKKLGDIQRKLRDNGIIKPTTALMKPILLLIRKKRLARTKPEKGQYLYTKR